MKFISTVDARIDLSDLINEIAFKNEDYILTRHGKNVAVIISVEKWKYFDKLNKKFKIID